LDNNKGRQKDKEDNIWQQFGFLGSVGFTLVLATFAGLALGLVLDRLTGLKPLFTVALLLFGIISGFLYLYYHFGKNGK